LSVENAVLLTDPIAAEGEAALARGARVVRSPDSSPETIRRLAREADGVITRSKLPDDLLDAAPGLRAIVIHGTGTHLVPLASAAARGVPAEAEASDFPSLLERSDFVVACPPTGTPSRG